MSTATMQAFNKPAARAPTERELVLFQNSNTTRGMLHALRNVSEPAGQRALTVQLLFAPSTTKNKSMKGVNSFMIYRSYYYQIPDLRGYTMKACSPSLSLLWNQDANQQLWDLMAKAYTIMRDQEKLSCKDFMNSVGPALNIPSPATYLEDHGWKFTLLEVDEIQLVRMPDALPVQSLVSAGLVDPAISVDDILRCAQFKGPSSGYKPEQYATSTFLGHSIQQAPEQADQRQAPVHTMLSVHDIRVAEKKNRRAKLQTGKRSSTILSLQAARSTGDKVTMEFSNALNICATGYSCGHYTVVLPENLQERYGNTLLKFFQDTLARKIGEDVNLTCITDLGGSKTFVQMRQVNVPQHRLDQELITSPQAASSVDCASPGDAVVAGQAKVPRPMNCFIYFRNAMAPQLLKEDPTLGVKHLSKRVSVIWKTFSAEQKEYWKLQAAAGTALHKRLNPDYKYQPRKSSQIKKRQSRKAKQASAAATVTAATAPAAAEAFRFAPVSEMMVATNNTEVTAAGQANVNNSFASDVAQAIDPTAFFGLQEQHLAHHLQLHETESLRYDRLHAEFDSAIGMNMTFEQFGEEAFAFRAGANGDATLPSIYSDGY